MAKGRTLTQKKYGAFFLTLAVLVATGLLVPFFAMGISPGWQVVGGGLAAFLFLCFYLPDGKQRIAPAAIITAVILSLLYSYGLQGVGDFVVEYVYWLGGTVSEERHAVFEVINICLGGLVLFPLLLLLERSFGLRLAAAIGLAVYLVFGMATGQEYRGITVCLCVLFILWVFVEMAQDAALRQRLAISLLPFMLLYFVILLAVPTDREPLGWRFIKSVYGSISEAVEAVSHMIGSIGDSERDGFGMEVSGFVGSELRGQTVGRSREVMEVELKSGKRSAIYLSGRVFDTFDGGEWRSEVDESEDEHMLDLIETVYALYRHDWENFGNYFQRAQMNVSYTRLRTEYLFAPLKTVGISPAGTWQTDLQRRRKGSNRGTWQDDVTERDGEWLFSARRGPGTEYSVNFYQMNLGHVLFRQLIRAEAGYAYGAEGMDESGAELFQRFRHDIASRLFSEELLRERSEDISSRYSQPYPLSEEVRAFLAEVTAGASDAYEACLMLEQTLAGLAGIEFIYTKTPEALPEGEVFPDYFLLHSRSGYCTYYATAFVLLAREMGLPTRYVQGYLVADERLGHAAVAVTNHMAHAWPEVYFGGVGWIPFEPTPGFASRRYSYWNPAVPSGATGDGGSAAALPPAAEGQTPPEAEETAETVTPPPSPPDHRRVYVVLIVLAGLVTAAAALFAAEHLVRRRRYLRHDMTGRFIEQVRLNLHILAILGYRVLPGETLYEFAARTGRGKEGLDIRFITPLEEIVYRGDAATEVMVATAVSDRQSLYRAIRQVGRWHYYLARIRLFVAHGIV